MSAVSAGVAEITSPTSTPCLPLRRSDSSAAEAGLRSGMLLTHVENVRVRTPSEFFQATSKYDGAANLKLFEASGEQAELVVQP